MFPSRAMAFSRSTASGLPTTSLSVCGRYFSTWAQQTRARNEGHACEGRGRQTVPGLEEHTSWRVSRVFHPAKRTRRLASDVPGGGGGCRRAGQQGEGRVAGGTHPGHELISRLACGDGWRRACRASIDVHSGRAGDIDHSSSFGGGGALWKEDQSSAERVGMVCSRPVDHFTRRWALRLDVLEAAGGCPTAALAPFYSLLAPPDGS
jgi:hypothetical protein